MKLNQSEGIKPFCEDCQIWSKVAW